MHDNLHKMNNRTTGDETKRLGPSVWRAMFYTSNFASLHNIDNHQEIRKMVDMMLRMVGYKVLPGTS
jgi:hypothetical protein